MLKDNTMKKEDNTIGSTLAESVIADAVNGAGIHNPEPKRTVLPTLEIHDFLAQEIPAREMMMKPFLPKKGLAMLYAYRGLGKTWLALNIGYHVAAGGTFMHWECPKPGRVLYVDGEMPAVVLQERLALIVKSADKTPQSGMFRLLSQDMQTDGIPDLTTPQGQAALDTDNADLIILDNLSTLCRTGRENDAESWLPMQEWALRMRRAGKSVLFVHHSNKNGGQRGSIRKEDVLDTVIALKQPQDFNPADGARFEVHFEKARGFYGDDAQSFEAKLTKGIDGAAMWTATPLEDTRLKKIVELKELGMTQREIATEIGIGVATVNRDLKRAEEEKKS